MPRWSYGPCAPNGLHLVTFGTHYKSVAGLHVPARCVKPEHEKFLYFMDDVLAVMFGENKEMRNTAATVFVGFHERSPWLGTRFHSLRDGTSRSPRLRIIHMSITSNWSSLYKCYAERLNYTTAMLRLSSGRSYWQSPADLKSPEGAETFATNIEACTMTCAGMLAYAGDSRN